jgi:uncharacterized phage protein (predicted DNA packaging)
MATVSLTEVKLHLRITGTDEDTILAIYMDAADDYVRKFLNRSIPGENESPVIIPNAIKAACLLIVGDLYENREGASEKVVVANPAVDRLLYPYREEIGV